MEGGAGSVEFGVNAVFEGPEELWDCFACFLTRVFFSDEGPDVGEELGHGGFPLVGFGEDTLADFDAFFPAAHEEDDAEATGGPATTGERVADGDEVFEGFGHFGAVDIEVAHVEEVVDPLVLAVGGVWGGIAAASDIFPSQLDCLPNMK